MAYDAFLKLDGHPGESKDSAHKDDIDLLSFSWGATNSGSSGLGGGGGAGVVNMHDFSFTMYHQKCSPKLMLACATGEHIKSAILIARKQGGTQMEFLKVEMNDLLVSSYQTGGSSGGGDQTIDSITLNFAKIKQSYKEQKQDGSAGGEISAGWDVKGKKKF